MGLEWITALLGVGGGAATTALVAGLFARRKVQAEAVEILTKASGQIVQRLEKDVERLMQENQQIRQENRDNSKRISCLERRDLKRARTEGWLVEYISELIDHIQEGLGPPPPDPPEGLGVKWPPGFLNAED